MAIAGVVNGSGTKAATAGTTFTIAFSQGSGASIYVGVAIPGGSVTVSSVTDTGANVYNRVNQIVLADLVIELWKTDKVAANGLTTITVTLSATGTLAAGVARSFTGVAFTGSNTATANGNSGTATTGSITTQDNTAGNTSNVICIFGLNANNTMTVSGSGTIRSQTGVTGAAVAITDQSRASPITQTVTMTSGEWGVIDLELRSLGVTTDTVTMSDAQTNALKTDSVVESADLQLVSG